MTDTAINDDIDTFAISTDDKVRGEGGLPEETSVLGTSTASSGTPVEGAIPDNAGGYGLVTPDDANTSGELGTTGYFRMGAPAGSCGSRRVILTVSP